MCVQRRGHGPEWTECINACMFVCVSVWAGGGGGGAYVCTCVRCAHMPTWQKAALSH